MNHQNNHNFPPNIDPQVFSWLACIIGSACCGNYNANEQNSFGNWLILVGQFILTNASQQQLINGRNQMHNTGQNWNSFNDNNNQINFLINAVNDLKQELENIKRNL